MRNCRLLLLTGAILAVLAMPALAANLSVDVWGEWRGIDGTPANYPAGFDDALYCGYSGTLDPTVTNTEGITMTLNGSWGGRNRGVGKPANVPPDFTEAALLQSWGSSWDPSDGSALERTVTISGLVPNMVYDTSLWGYEHNNPQGWDVSANGVLVVDDFLWTPNPDHNDLNRSDFQATADGSGVVVLEYSDPTSGDQPGNYLPYKINGIMMTAVPEPGSLVLLLGLAGLGLVSFLRRK